MKVGIHPGGNPGANLKSTSHRYYLFEIAFVWQLTKETIVLPLGCHQGGAETEKEGVREAGLGERRLVLAREEEEPREHCVQSQPHLKRESLLNL